MYRTGFFTPKQRRAVQIWIALAPKGSGLVKDVKKRAETEGISWRVMSEVRPHILAGHGQRTGWNGENHEYELKAPVELAELKVTRTELSRDCTCGGWPYTDEDHAWRCICCAKSTRPAA